MVDSLLEDSRREIDVEGGVDDMVGVLSGVGHLDVHGNNIIVYVFPPLK